ncbi:MAG: YdcF family protein [Clostridium sp.]|nr:YdcF family protein [Clostridium sp.]
MNWSNEINHSKTCSYGLIGLFYVIGIMLAPSLWMVIAVLFIWVLFLKRSSIHWFKALILLGLIFFIVIESALVHYIIQEQKASYSFKGTETIVIPGAAVVGDEPGSFLRSRLELAVDLMETHQAMPVVVSGGRSPEDSLGEAEAMRGYLEQHGIAPDRIHEESLGYDTIRNLEYSKAVIQEKGLSLDVVIISNEFHNFRIKSIARTIGLNPVTLATPTSHNELLRYMVREIASLIKVQLHYGFRLKWT